MKLNDIIFKVLSQIGVASDAGSVNDGDADLVRGIINDAIMGYNMQDFLHFTQEIVSFPAGQSEYVIERDAPVKIASLSFNRGGEVYRLRPVPMTHMPAYLESHQDVPSVFCYSRKQVVDVDENVNVEGRLLLNKPSRYPLTAVVNANIRPFSSSDDVFILPPEYERLVVLDAQLRWMMSKNFPENMRASKNGELQSVIRFIKENNFKGIDSQGASRYVDQYDVIRSGYGRL